MKSRKISLGVPVAAETQPRFPSFLPLIPPFLLYLLLCQEFFTFTNDDPFIVFRYADNLRRGIGPVMNAGERVEGFSSPLHLGLITLLRGLPLDPLLLAKWLGIAFGLATIAQVYAIGRRLHGTRDSACYIAPGLLAANAWFGLQSVNALETTLAAFLITLTFGWFLREESAPPRGQLGLSGLAAGLAALTRPEAPLLFIGVAAGSLLISGRRTHRARIGLWLRRGGWFILVFGSYLGFRLVYYGQWLPNTYFAKHLPLVQAMNLGVRYLIPILGVNIGIAILAILPWAIRVEGDRRFLGAAVAGCLLAEGVFILLSGGDWMEGYRFLVPVMPLLFLGLQEGWRGLLASRAPRLNSSSTGASVPPRPFGRLPALRSTRAGAWAVVLGFAVLTLLHDAYQIRCDDYADSWRGTNWSLRYRDLLGSSHFRSLFVASDSLGSISRPGELVAIGEAGLIPFEHPELRFIDEHGLTDGAIARMDVPRYLIGPQADYTDPNSRVARYILAHQPGVIVRGTNRWTDERARADRLEGFELRVAMKEDLDGRDVGFLIWRRQAAPVP